MFDIITKQEFWEWQDAGLVDASRIDLKGVQDAYVLSRLSDVRGRRILEVGGGNSRVLTTLTEDERDNECWNADRFEGFGGGPRRSTNTERIRVAYCFLGEFSEELPDEYFDYIISVSVVEHVPTDELGVFMADSRAFYAQAGRSSTPSTSTSSTPTVNTSTAIRFASDFAAICRSPIAPTSG